MGWFKAKRASAEAMIRALVSCADGRGVCEGCGGDWPLNELTTVWIGQDNEEEGIDLCRGCKAEGDE